MFHPVHEDPIAFEQAQLEQAQDEVDRLTQANLALTDQLIDEMARTARYAEMLADIDPADLKQAAHALRELDMHAYHDIAARLRLFSIRLACLDSGAREGEDKPII